MMNNQLKISNHPFPSLLYLEWILLTITALIAVIPPSLQRSRPKLIELSICGTFPDLSICNLLPKLSIYSLIIFALMGLMLPINTNKNRIIYTAFEITLVLIIGLFGKRFARLFPVLYIILVTRSCLIFNLPGRLFFYKPILYIISLYYTIKIPVIQF